MSENPFEAPAESFLPKNHATALASLVIATCLLFLNLDGYQIHLASPVGPGNLLRNQPGITWMHGWPCCFLVRDSIYPLSGIRNADGSFSGPSGLYSRWPIDSASISPFWPLMLILDLVFFVAVVAGANYGIRLVPERRLPGGKLQLIVLALLSSLAALSVIFVQFRLVFTTLALLVVFVGVALALIAAAHAAGAGFRSIQRICGYIPSSDRVA